MPKIRILPDSLINRIAAGEVVERPASVVKELAENAIDAGARMIDIELKEGGMSLIRMTDDGTGMDEEDARLCLTRHATSKLPEERLEGIGTMGFRGEALASIASVSRLTIRTRIDSLSLGFEVVSDSGKIISESGCACPRGTQISVKDLFYNTPARKRHLRTIAYELRQVTDTVGSLALAHEEIRWKLWHEDALILQAESPDLPGRIAEIFGAQAAKNMIPLSFQSKELSIEGHLSKPGWSRKDRRFQSLYVNRRFVRDERLARAVYEGYRTMLGIGRHPAFVIRVSVPTDEVDVNVHPSKLLVRLDREEMIAKHIESAVRETMQGVIGPAETALSHDRPLTLGSFTIEAGRQTSLEPEPTTTLRILGQVRSTYVIIERDEGLLLMDQHAAMERVLYEKYTKEYKEGLVATQQLLEPFVAELSPQEAVAVKANLDAISKFGFSLEEFGRSAFLVKSIPLAFQRNSAPGILNDIIDALGATSSSEKDEKIIRKACRASVKANTPLEIAEIRKLVRELFRCSQPYTCPHGRPTLISYSFQDLERMFKRTGF